MFHTTFDLTSVMLIVGAFALLLLGASVLAPKWAEVQTAWTSAQLAPERVKAEMQAQANLAKAQADEISARAEVSKTLALANADAIRMTAQANLVDAQRRVAETANELERIKGGNALALQNAQDAWKLPTIIAICLVLAVFSLCGAFVMHTNAIGHPQRTVALAIRENGGSVTVEPSGAIRYDVATPEPAPPSQYTIIPQKPSLPAYEQRFLPPSRKVAVPRPAARPAPLRELKFYGEEEEEDDA